MILNDSLTVKMILMILTFLFKSFSLSRQMQNAKVKDQNDRD